MSPRSAQAGKLAALILTQPLTPVSSEAAHAIWGAVGKLLSFRRLHERVVVQFGGQIAPPRLRALAGFLEQQREFSRIVASRAWSSPLLLEQWPVQQMSARSPSLQGLILPEITTIGGLAEWLGLDVGRMEWMASLRQRPRGLKDPRLEHYRYHWLERVGRRARLIEAPKFNLKQVQRQILKQILNIVPPHSAAHAYRPDRSIRSCVEPHVGRHVVLHVDVRDFFPSISIRRAMAVFRTIGYPEAVARLLAGLCTHATPRNVIESRVKPLDDMLLWSQLTDRHLPQGVPTSPALANLCCWRLDCRLKGLADCFDAHYTRYADDLIFSGDERFDHRMSRFRLSVTAILINEGFAVRERKTRVMRRHRRQHAGGLVLNALPNVPREDYDHLKATLYNCVRLGAASQNRDQRSNFREHLRGRIALVLQIHPHRGARLKALFDQIGWHDNVPMDSADN